MEPIPFNKPYITGNELQYMSSAVTNGALKGGGPFLRKCEAMLEAMTGSPKAILTHSCTGALELSGLLLDIRPGDEVIMPSFTFVSTANAYVLRGAVPVFVDIRLDTLNIDENLIEEAITPKTKLIVVVHYAGVSCEMDTILAIAERHNLKVVEDAAHGVMAKYKGRPLGTLGIMGTYSFHETKNLVCGEGGCLLVNDSKHIDSAEVMADRGTDRAQFLLGQARNYGWVQRGSAFQPSELGAAFLVAQLEQAENITTKRLAVWNYYHDRLGELERQGLLQRPTVPAGCEHNAHLYYLLIKHPTGKQQLLRMAKAEGIAISEHYRPLHNSVGGKIYGKCNGSMPVTCMVAEQLVRLPLWIGLGNAQQNRVIELLKTVLNHPETL